MFWVTSDWHLFHRSILYMQKRPFKNEIEMNEEIIRRFNSRVCKGDKVYILGDISLHADPSEVRKCLERMNGKKFLVRGNHDCNIKPYEDMFEEISLMMKVQDYNKEWWMCHYGLQTWGHISRGAINLMGHSHNKPEFNIQNRKRHFLQYDVGVEANDYYPVSSKQILEFFGKEALNNPFNNHHKKNIIEKIKYFFIR